MAPASMIGEIAAVRITGISTNSLFGELTNGNAHTPTPVPAQAGA
jgi:hypothetical protein